MFDRSNHVTRMLEESFVLLPTQRQVDQDVLKDQQKTAAPKEALRERAQTSNLDKQVTTLTNIFELVSDISQVDSPICHTCHAKVMKELNSKLEQIVEDTKKIERTLQAITEKEKRNGESTAANGCEGDVEDDCDNDGDDGDDDDAMADISDEDLKRRLASVRHEREEVKRRTIELQMEASQLDAFERRFWHQFQDFELAHDSLCDSHFSLKEQLASSSATLTQLKRTNVIDTAFHIGHDGHFGTISGFRLGRLATQQVEWAETNAALGQMVLLLQTVSEKLHFNFSSFKLIPMGSFSKIGKVGESTVCELHGSNELSLGKLFWYRRFDTALVWLLQCIEEFCQYCEKIDQRFETRYPVVNDTIGGLSVKLQFNPEDKWTKAMKYLLANLKLVCLHAAEQIK